MSAATLPRTRAARRQDHLAPSFAMALAMHGLLFVAMTFAVQWRTQPQAPIVAELWGAIAPTPAPNAQPAPPPPPPPAKVEPEPAPRAADIALKKEKIAPPPVEPKKEQARPEPRKDEPKKEARKAEPQAPSDLDRIIKQAAATAASAPPTDNAAANAGGGAREANWFGAIGACIRQHLNFPVPEGTATAIYAEFRVELLPDASIAGVRLVRASGLAGYDAAAERAINRCNPFPRARDGTLPLRSVPVVMRPAEAR